MLAVALGLGASLAWGLSDFVGGLKSRQLALLGVVLVSQVSGLVVMGVAVAARGEGPPAGEYLGYAAIAGVVGTVAIAAFYRGLAVGAMSVVAPISATAPLIPVVFGVASGERPSELQVAGIALALAGVVLASREKAPEAGRAGMAAGVGLALVAAVGIGCFFTAIDAASEGDVLWSLLVSRMVSTVVVGAAVMATRPAFAPGARDLRALVMVGTFDVGANVLFGLASTRGLVSVVAVLASLYPIVTIALARRFLGERFQRLQGVGVVVALMGVAAISAG